jgi:cullin-4
MRNSTGFGGLSGSGSGSGGSRGAKKLKIKPLKLKPRLPADFVEKTWHKLQGAITGVFSQSKVAYSFEELYRAAEDLCLHKKAEFVYQNLRDECEKQVVKVLEKLVPLAMEPWSFLQEVEREWQTHCNQLLTIRSIFLYLDRTFVLQNAHLKSIFDMGLDLFRQQIEKCPTTERTLSSGLVQMIHQERKGEHVDRKVLKSLLKMLLSLGLYLKHFESEFLKETQQFYQQEGTEKMRDMPVLDYLVHCENRLREEEGRCTEYLDSFTFNPLMKIIEECLLKKHMHEILEKGFATFMDQLKLADLKRLYTLCDRVGNLDSLRDALSNYVKQRAGDYVTDEKNDPQMVQNLIRLKSNMDKVLEECFDNKDSFHGSLKEAFEHSINLRQNRPAELVAKYIDSKLRSGNKGGGDEELENTLDSVLVIFRYISGKDVFEAFYKKDLAKRLLLGKSSSIDAEKSTISKLKTECGSQFTNKLEGMFKDIDISRDIMTGLKNSAQVQSKLKHGIELSVNVLTTGYWPTYPPVKVNLPPELSEYQEIFKSYYLSKHSGRRLVWQNSLGQCVVKCKFKKASKELVVSLFQAVVLMLYNDEEKLTYTDIEKATGIEPKELKRTLQSLSLGKVRVLLKDPKTKEVNPNDTFTFHSSFTAPLYRLRINNIQMKETQEENQSTTERVFQDRQYQVDAAIVRIMKSRKTLSHTLLISELYGQLRFPIKPADLKKRIESLIDREYLERDAQSVYNYLA